MPSVGWFRYQHQLSVSIYKNNAIISVLPVHNLWDDITATEENPGQQMGNYINKTSRPHRKKRTTDQGEQT